MPDTLTRTARRARRRTLAAGGPLPGRTSRTGPGRLPLRDLDVALTEAREGAEAQLVRADNKATALFGVIATALTGVGLVASLVQVPLAAAIVGGLGAAVLVAAADSALRVVRSRLSGDDIGQREGFPYLATLTPAQILVELRHDRRAEAVAKLARLAVMKHRHIRRAVFRIRVAGLLLAASAAIAVAGTFVG